MSYSWRRAVEDVRCRGMLSARETSIVIDSAGNVVDRATGTRHGVSLSPMEAGMRRGRKYSHVHYHHDDYPPSLDDVRIAYQMKNKEKLNVDHAVVTSRRAIHFSPGEGGMREYEQFRHARSQQIDREVHGLAAAYKKRVKAWHKGGKKGPRPAKPNTKRRLLGVMERATKDQLRKRGGRYDVRYLRRASCKRR